MENFLQKAKKKFGDLYDYSMVNYVNANTKVNVRCTKHNVDFLITPGHHLHGQKTTGGCPGCKQDNQTKLKNETPQNLSDNFIRKSQMKYPRQFDYSLVEYTNNRTPVTLVCKVHDWQFDVAPYNHLRSGNQTGSCEKCKNDVELNDTNNKNLEFVAKSELKYGADKFDYSNVNYVNQKTLISLKCLKHQCTFEVTPKMHLRKVTNSGGCDMCAKELSAEANKKPKNLKKHKPPVHEEIKIKKQKIQCSAMIWKKGKFVQCLMLTLDGIFCKNHTYYKEEWLEGLEGLKGPTGPERLNKNTQSVKNGNSVIVYTICNRCNRGFEKNGNVRCDQCNQKGQKKKNEACQFIKKNGDQCTNQRKKKSQYCGTHIGYADKGVTPANRCIDCGDPKESSNVRVCRKCLNTRNEKAQEKRSVAKEIRMNKPVKSISQDEWEISPYFVGGFFDGDGSICIDKNYCLQVSFSQCPPEILHKLQGVFGGKIYKRDNTNKRDQHNLRVCGTECEKIIRYLDIGCILKWEQIQVAKKFIRLGGVWNLEQEKETKYQEMKSLNNSYKKTHTIDRYGLINWEYLAGLFDAEGCIQTRSKRTNKGTFDSINYIKITQSYCLKFLEAIKKFVGHGRIETNNVWKTDRIDFVKWDLNKMLKYLVVKKHQAQWALDLLDAPLDAQEKRARLCVKIREDKKKNQTNLT